MDGLSIAWGGVRRQPWRVPPGPYPPSAGPSDRFAAVTDRLLAPVILLSRTGAIEYVNTAAATLFQQDRGWLVGRPFEEITHPGDRARLRDMLRKVATGRPTGRTAIVRVRAQPAADWRFIECIADNVLEEAEIGGILLSVHDVTESQAETRALAELAYRDPLTGLPNRAKLVAELERRLGTDGEVVVGLIGIDRLNQAEDVLGWAGSGTMVEAVGRRLRSLIPSAAILGRLERGTFATILSGRLARTATATAWRVAQRIRAPMFVGSIELNPTVSVGLGVRVADATVESLLSDAGIALHRAEALGGGRVESFSNDLRAETIAQLKLEADLRRAIANESMTLAFQPLVRLPDRQIVASEALLRWRHQRGELQPADFIPIAEKSGLIVPLGEWVVRTSARLAGQVPGGRVSVNLSPRQLAMPGLPRLLDSLVTAHTDRASVDFEITETLLIEDWEHTSRVLADLRRLGFRVGLDDFGTGYSSLAYLRRLPIDFLKIDRSLVADIDVERQARAVIGAVIRMAEALELEVVAEGVERESQAAALIDLGATQAQGHLFGAAEELPHSP